MRTEINKFILAFVMIIVATAAVGGVGIIAENKIGIIDRVMPDNPDNTLMVEFGSFFEFASTEQFAGATEYMLTYLATYATPLAVEVSYWLTENPLDANDVQQGVADILLGIAGSPIDRKGVYMMNMVSMPIIFGANYGKFAAMRAGATEPEDVNRIVTAHAATALGGLLRFLSDLPCPEESDPKQQLDEWADELDSADGL